LEGLVAVGLALLSIPFVLPLISWFVMRGLKLRISDLEQRVGAQADEIRTLSGQLAKVRSAAESPQPTTKPATPPPAVAPTPTPVTVTPPPVTATPPAVTVPPPPVVATPRVAPTPPPIVAPPVAASPDVPPAPPRVAPKPVAPVPPPVAVSRPAAPAAASRPAVPPPVPPPVPPRPPIAPRAPEPPPPPPPSRDWSFDWEQLVGVKLFSAIAGIALVMAAIFFLRYSIDHGWLQPPVRVVIGILTAVALLVTCERKAARKYPLTANALDAAAIAILFATFFSAHSLWKLIPATPTFGLLALVTATAVMLSIRRDSLFIAVLGLVGGFAAPVLLSSNENRPIPLFAYLLLLNIGLAWVAYRRGWAILSAVSLLLTTLYQWGWVFKYLASSPLPLALAIFIVFPVVGYAGYLLAQSRPGTRDHAGEDTFEWTALVSAAAPLLFAVYLATVRPYGQNYWLLFGYLFLINSGLFAIAVSRGRELLHVLGALATLVVTVAWMASSYAPGTWMPIVAIVSGFIAFYLAAPAIAEAVGRPFEEAGSETVYAAPLLMFVFPVIARIDPAAAAPTALFACVFAILLVLAWRALSTGDSAVYYVGVFFALAAEATWSATHLTMERLSAAMMLYAVFGLLYLGVPLVARGMRRELEPRPLGGVVLVASLLLLLFLATGPFAGPAMWGLALLLVIMTAAIFVESAATALPATALVGSALSWVVLAVWWANASASLGVLPLVMLITGLALLTLAGHGWTYRQARSAKAPPAVLEQFGYGSWIALAAYVFLLAVAVRPELVMPPWPFFGGLAVVALAISTAAFASRAGTLHLVSTAAAAVVLFGWMTTTQAAGYAMVALSAEAALVVFALSWIALGRRGGFEQRAAGAAATAIVIAHLTVLGFGREGAAPPLAILVGAHVTGVTLLLALSARYRWSYGATGASALAAAVLLAVQGRDAHLWQPVFAHALALYVPFALYPMVLGRRARDTRDPYLAAILASIWCFVAARFGMERAGYGWMVGVVPVTLGAITALHVRQLLRLQSAGSRDLGRLALVAGTALAFATVAIPLQLSHQWITIGWALEGAAVAWLYTRVPHRGLLYTSVGLFAAVFARLALNPQVFRYEPRGSMRIVNWYLYAYLICAAAMFLAAWWLSRTEDELHEGLPRPRHVLPAAGGILLFLLLNIEIADFYATGPEIMFRFGAGIAQDLTYTLGWLVFGLATLACGIVLHNRAARIASVVLITVTTLKCFLYDLSSLGGLYRVGAFVGLALSLTLVSFALQKFVLTPGKDTAR
jgi:uncharacterized membrane protein